MFPQQSADRTAYATQADIEAGQVTGVGYAIPVETGIPVAVYVNDAPARPAPLPVLQQPAQQTVVVQRAGLDPVTARIAAGSAGAVGVAVAVGHYAHQLAEFAHAAEGAGVAIGVLAIGARLALGGSTKVSVTVNNSNTGSSSSSSATSSSHSSSRLWGQR